MIATWWDNLRESCDMRMMVGAGTVVAWLLLLAVSPIFSTTPTLIAQGFSWRIIVIASATVVFIATFFASRAHRPNPGKPHSAWLIAGSATAFLGVLLHSFSENPAFDIVSAVFVAYGVAALCLGWAQPFSAIRLRKRVVASAAGTICGCFLYLAIVIVPQPFALFIGSCLPIVSIACLIVLQTKPAAEQSGDAPPPIRESLSSQEPLSISALSHLDSSPSLSHRSSNMHPFGRELSAAIFLYGMLFVLAGHVLPETESAWVSSVAPGVINVAAFLLIEIILTVYMVRRVHRENPVVAYRPATILVAVAFLLLPFSTAELSITCMAVAFAGFGSFMVFFWIVMGNICQKWHLSHLRVFTQGFLTLLIGIATGELIAWLLYLLRHPGFDYVATLSIVSLFLLVVMAWQMSDGSRFANETKEMGGQFFDPTENDMQENADGMPDLEHAAERYRLSPRESEVLALLLKGRSIPYICDELFIAKSTAQTHVRHIYAKMEITGGRQELIDRIEQGEKTSAS